MKPTFVHLDSCLSEKIVHLQTSETFCRRRSPSSFDSKLSSSGGRVPEAYNSIPATLWSRLRSMGEFMNQKDFLTIFCCCYERSLNKVVKCCLYFVHLFSHVVAYRAAIFGPWQPLCRALLRGKHIPSGGLVLETTFHPSSLGHCFLCKSRPRRLPYGTKI